LLQAELGNYFCREETGQEEKGQEETGQDEMGIAPSLFAAAAAAAKPAPHDKAEVAQLANSCHHD
jgi:hypothetical protein